MPKDTTTIVVAYQYCSYITPWLNTCVELYEEKVWYMYVDTGSTMTIEFVNTKRQVSRSKVKHVATVANITDHHRPYNDNFIVIPRKSITVVNY